MDNVQTQVAPVKASAGGLPGEAGIEAALWREMKYALADARTLATPDDKRVEAYWRERIRSVLAAGPAAALRAVLREPEAREELKRLLTSAVPVLAAHDEWQERGWRAHGPELMRMLEASLGAAVDALASGVEGDAGTEGEGTMRRRP